MAHTKGTPVATPTFFADPNDPRLRTVENSFLLGPLLVQTSTVADHGSDELLHVLPKGIWLQFDFDDSHPDLPILYLQGGSIIPTGHPLQHVGEANLTDDLTLIVALDEYGKAEGSLFEDEGDGYEFNEGGYLLTYYAAEYQSSVVTIKVSKCEGSWARPKRRLHVKLLLAGGAMVDAWGVDGEILKIRMPSNTEISKLVSISEEQYKNRLETAKRIPDREDEISEHKEMPRTPSELRSSDWVLKVVPWIGGRMFSMHHISSGTEWLQTKVDEGGYEEYSDIENKSSRCYEEYDIIETKNEKGGENESLTMEGDIGGGLVFQRKISISENDSSVIRIDSGIMAQNLAAVSGGYSRLVCLRVHPVFAVLHPKDVCVTFVSINGCKHEVWPESSVQVFEGELLPNGAWTLVDRFLGLGLVNKFDVNEVHKCLIHWEAATVSMELCSKERRVSTESPLRISHQYEVKSE